MTKADQLRELRERKASAPKSPVKTSRGDRAPEPHQRTSLSIPSESLGVMPVTLDASAARTRGPRETKSPAAGHLIRGARTSETKGGMRPARGKLGQPLNPADARTESHRGRENDISVTQVPTYSGPPGLSNRKEISLQELKQRYPSKRGRPRIGDAPRPRPWEDLGMSERTWYRRQKEKKV